MIDYEPPSRKPQLGPSPIEGDEFFARLMNSPDTVRERQAREALRRQDASRDRPYVDPTEYEDGEAD